MIKRFSSFRKIIRLSVSLASFFIVYFVILTALLPHNSEPDINTFDLVYYDTTPINFDNDDGKYIGNVINYKTVKNFKTFGSQESVSEDAICLFTQLSADRLDMFIKLATSWNSYVSVALYIEDENHIDYFVEKLEGKLNHGLSKGARIDLSLLYAVDLTRKSNSSIHPYDILYPINALRNLALNQCKSQYAFSLDVDFSVSQSTKDTISSHLDLLKNAKSPLALVVPVFEWVFEKEVMPDVFDLEQLRSYCSNGRIIPFHAKKLARTHYSKTDLKEWCYGKSFAPKHLKITRVQSLTNYTKWLSASEVYPVSKKANVLDLYYEPYFVARKEIMPLFSERFRGYGFNKRANAMSMQYVGFEFMVLPTAFAVHRYHPPSAWRTQLKHDLVIQKTLGRTFDLYKEELKLSKKQKTL